MIFFPSCGGVAIASTRWTTRCLYSADHCKTPPCRLLASHPEGKAEPVAEASAEVQIWVVHRVHSWPVWGGLFLRWIGEHPRVGGSAYRPEEKPTESDLARAPC